MSEYHKIYSPFKRDEKTRKLIFGDWSRPEFGYLANNVWDWTEKVDGTNIRIIWDGETMRIGGRTDAAQLYIPLLEVLQAKFYSGALAQIFDGPAVLYGEGYGAKIQKGGGNYKSDGVDICLFDVRVGKTWLKREDVHDIASKLNVGIAPVIGEGTLFDAIDYVADRPKSTWGDFESEGLVTRPKVEILDRMGRRVITKIKVKDVIGMRGVDG